MVEKSTKLTLGSQVCSMKSCLPGTVLQYDDSTQTLTFLPGKCPLTLMMLDDLSNTVPTVTHHCSCQADACACLAFYGALYSKVISMSWGCACVIIFCVICESWKWFQVGSAICGLGVVCLHFLLSPVVTQKKNFKLAFNANRHSFVSDGIWTLFET